MAKDKDKQAQKQSMTAGIVSALEAAIGDTGDVTKKVKMAIEKSADKLVKRVNKLVGKADKDKVKATKKADKKTEKKLKKDEHKAQKNAVKTAKNATRNQAKKDKADEALAITTPKAVALPVASTPKPSTLAKKPSGATATRSATAKKPAPSPASEPTPETAETK